jgi:glycosyltransferase involved in cell wall biosynthesis
LQISPGWETKVAEAIERRLYRAATVAIGVTQPFCDHIDAIRDGGPPTVLLPNGTMPQFFAARDDGIRARLGIPAGRFLATFAGTLGIAQALPSVLDAASVLESEAELLLVGDGPMKSLLVADAEERGLRNVRFEPQVPLEEILPVLAASDALLVPLSAHPTFQQFVPSKLIDFMATGRPVVLAAAGESARLLEASGGGVAVPPEDPEALARAVRRLRDDRDGAAAMGRRGREFARTRLRSEQAAQLEQILLEVTRRD